MQSSRLALVSSLRFAVVRAWLVARRARHFALQYLLRYRPNAGYYYFFFMRSKNIPHTSTVMKRLFFL